MISELDFFLRVVSCGTRRLELRGIFIGQRAYNIMLSKMKLIPQPLTNGNPQFLLKAKWWYIWPSAFKPTLWAYPPLCTHPYKTATACGWMPHHKTRAPKINTRRALLLYPMNNRMSYFCCTYFDVLALPVAGELFSVINSILSCINMPFYLFGFGLLH